MRWWVSLVAMAACEAPSSPVAPTVEDTASHSAEVSTTPPSTWTEPTPTGDTGVGPTTPSTPPEALLPRLSVATREGRAPNPTDHEVDPVLGKIVFTDTIDTGPTTGTWVWVASVGGDGDWVSDEPVLLSTRGNAVPLTGFGTPQSRGFPNNAEWSRARGGASRVYWSAYTQGPLGPAVLQRNEFDPVGGFSVDPTTLLFRRGASDYRYLINASYSSDQLDDRYLVYLRIDPLLSRSAFSWCLDRGGRTWDERLPMPHEPPNGISFTARPIPDTYALLMVRDTPGDPGSVDLLWSDLVPTHPRPPEAPTDNDVVLHTWRSAAGLTFVGVGAVRAPLLDTPTDRAYAVYALMRSDDDLRGTATWFDSFLVRYHVPPADVVGAIDQPGRVYATPDTVTVDYGHRMTPDVAVVGDHPFMVDDEPYTGVDQKPYVVAVMSPDALAHTDTQLWAYELLGPPPASPYVVDVVPPFATPALQLRLTQGGPRQLLDPQPGPLLDTTVDPPVWRDHVFFRELASGSVRYDFWSATP